MKSAYSQQEELANWISHGVGAIFGVFALALMVVVSLNNTDKLISSIVYGLSIILLFTASTLYHFISNDAVRLKLKTIDHLAIYILIAGTYTPYMLISLAEGNGTNYLSWIWGFAFLGICFKLLLGHSFPKLSLASYIGMGWFIVIASQELSESVSQKGLVFLFIGGLTYTLGAIFYAWKSLKFNHAIWHLFVLGGAFFHFWSIYWYVLQ